MPPLVFVGYHVLLLLSMIGRLFLKWCRLVPLVAVDLSVITYVLSGAHEGPRSAGLIGLS